MVKKYGLITPEIQGVRFGAVESSQRGIPACVFSEYITRKLTEKNRRKLAVAVG
jgi:hypothetical protein